MIPDGRLPGIRTGIRTGIRSDDVPTNALPARIAGLRRGTTLAHATASALSVATLRLSSRPLPRSARRSSPRDGRRWRSSSGGSCRSSRRAPRHGLQAISSPPPRSMAFGPTRRARRTVASSPGATSSAMHMGSVAATSCTTGCSAGTWSARPEVAGGGAVWLQSTAPSARTSYVRPFWRQAATSTSPFRSEPREAAAEAPPIGRRGE